MSALGYERELAQERILTGKADPREKIPQGKATNILAAKFRTNRKYIESLERLFREAPGVRENFR